jgi:hypothetical protein
MKRTDTEIVFGPQDLSDHNSILDTSIVPIRAVMTLTGVFTRRMEGMDCVLLCNPHPETWNTWMFPYASRVVDPQGAFVAGMDCADVVAVLKSLWSTNPSVFEATAAEVIAMVGGKSKTESFLFHEDYAIRYSKSANCWSAYDFHYYSFANAEVIEDNAIEQAWVRLNGSISQELYNLYQTSRKNVSANVVEFLEQFGSRIPTNYDM